MATIHIEQDEQGAILVSIDDAEPMEVGSPEEVCQIVKQALGGAGPEGAGEQAFQEGYKGAHGMQSIMSRGM